jgi:hypothetical protein
MPLPEDDDKILAIVQKRKHTLRVAWLITAIALAVWVLLFPVIAREVPRLVVLYVVSVPLVIVVAFFVVAWLTRLPREAHSEPILLKRGEELRQGRTVNLILFPFVMGIQLHQLLTNTPTTYSRALFIVTALVGAGIVHGIIPLRRSRRVIANVIEDELSASLRSQSLRVGYWVLMLGVPAVYVAGIYDPPKTPMLLLILLWMAVTVPSLWFVGLDWLAGRGE